MPHAPLNFYLTHAIKVIKKKNFTGAPPLRLPHSSYVSVSLNFCWSEYSVLLRTLYKLPSSTNKSFGTSKMLYNLLDTISHVKLQLLSCMARSLVPLTLPSRYLLYPWKDNIYFLFILIWLSLDLNIVNLKPIICFIIMIRMRSLSWHTSKDLEIELRKIDFGFA